MLKPDDPAVGDLAAELRKVASSRWEKGDLWNLDDTQVWGTRDEGVRFEDLQPADRTEVLDQEVAWKRLTDQGLSNAQAAGIFSNVRDGKPPERWLEGIFDEAVLDERTMASFKAMVDDSRTSPDNHVFDEMNGDWLPWSELSAAAKLQYIARDAVISEVSFKAFAEVARDVIGENMEAALQVLLEHQKELRGISKLLPDDDGTWPTPLVERVEDLMDYVAALETRENERQLSKGKLFEAISNALDGKTPNRCAEAVKGLDDILREDQPMPEQVRTQERGGRKM